MARGPRIMLVISIIQENKKLSTFANWSLSTPTPTDETSSSGNSHQFVSIFAAVLGHRSQSVISFDRAILGRCVVD